MKKIKPLIFVKNPDINLIKSLLADPMQMPMNKTLLEYLTKGDLPNSMII